MPNLAVAADHRLAGRIWQVSRQISGPPAGLSTSSRYSVRPVCTVSGPPYRYVVDFKGKRNFKIAARSFGRVPRLPRRDSVILLCEH